MTDRTQLFSIIALVIVLSGFALWLFLTKPSQDEVASLQQPPEPIPTIDVSQLGAPELLSRTVQGAIPVSGDGVGREDPFVSQ